MSFAGPQSSPAGWYADPYGQGTMRFYDGAAWTSHVTPAQKQAGLGSSPSDPVHWLVPTGRTWQSVTAGYVALFAVVLWVLGPVALWLGVWGLRASARSVAHGRGRAIFAIIVGALSSLAALAVVITSVT